MRRDQGTVQMLGGDLVHGLAVVRKTPRHKMIQRCTQTVNITPSVCWRTRKMFRTDILRRSHDLIGIFTVRLFADTGKTEIGKFCTPAGCQHNIIRLDIPVDQFLFHPRIIQGFRNLLHDQKCLIAGQLFLFRKHIFHGLAANIFHGKIKYSLIFTHSIRLDDVGVIQFRRRTRFPDKIIDKLRIIGKLVGKNFQGC